MESKGEIAYKSDIIDQMEKELDMPREKIEANVELMLQAMKIRSEEPECGTMYLTNIGTMYFRVNTVFRAVERAEKGGKEMKPYMKLMKKKVELLQPLLDKKYGALQRRIERRVSTYVNKGLDIEGIEKFQNKKYNEFKERQKYS